MVLCVHFLLICSLPAIGIELQFVKERAGKEINCYEQGESQDSKNVNTLTLFFFLLSFGATSCSAQVPGTPPCKTCAQTFELSWHTHL